MNYRVELDLTQTQLAEKINAKRKSISRYKTGASLPSMKTLVKIAKVLKKPAGYSFGGVRCRGYVPNFLFYFLKKAVLVMKFEAICRWLLF